MRKKIELLAPAGNMESLKAAVAAGCDAVYCGGTTFSARAFAGNFDHEEIKEAIRYCHIHGVRVYVTVNTLLFETEIVNAQKEITFLYENDVDALLIQDMGLFHWTRTVYPDLELHCSTQMHIHNLDGAKFMKEMGASRIVLARESSIETVRQCVESGIDVEIFGYGAICISYSGQCLMSQAMKNRSGNRGMCAQMCRLKYWGSNGNESFPNKNGDYLLSPRDLNTLDRIPELIESGAVSLKIEGRMKRPEYVWLVTHLYREAIEAYYEGRKWTISDEDHKALLLMFNREFSYGHLFHASAKERMNPYRPNHLGVTVGTVERYEKGRVLVRLSDTLTQHDGLRILNEPTDTGLTAVRIEKNGKLVNRAEAGDLVWLDCKSKPNPKKGQKLQRTTATDLIEEIRTKIAQNERKTFLSLRYELFPDQPMKLIGIDEDGHEVTVYSEQMCQQAKNAPLSKEKIENSLSKFGNSYYELKEISGVTADAFFPVSVMNETRRKLLEEMDRVRAHRYNRKGAQTYTFHVTEKKIDEPRLLVQCEEVLHNLPEKCAQINEAGADYDLQPVVNEENASHNAAHMILSELGDLHYPDTDAIIGMTLNCTNSYALAFYYSLPSVNGVILSSELSNQNISLMLEAFKARNGFVPKTYRLVYGRRTLMYIKGGIGIKDCKYIEDVHKNVYPLRYRENFMEILEPEPYRSANDVCYGSYLILNEESDSEKREVIEEAYEEVFTGI